MSGPFENVGGNFEDQLLEAVTYYSRTGNDVRLRHLMSRHGFSVEKGHVLIIAPQAQPFFGAHDLPGYVRVDPKCEGAALAPSWKAWEEERESVQEREHRRTSSGFRRSGSGGSTGPGWARYAQDFERAWPGARGAHFSDFDGGTYAKSEPFHKRVDLSGGDCVEVTARVVADNPHAPMARPERMKP